MYICIERERERERERADFDVSVVEKIESNTVNDSLSVVALSLQSIFIVGLSATCRPRDSEDNQSNDQIQK